jgi:hypothetical protein
MHFPFFFKKTAFVMDLVWYLGVDNLLAFVYGIYA